MRRLLLAIAFLACKNPVDKLDIIVGEGAVQFTPPALYAELWQKMEACSGLAGDFNAVTWYHSPRIDVGGKSYDGGWLGKQNVIVIVDARVENIVVVSHEEMHALLQGGLDHPVKYFNGACGDLTTVKENPSTSSQ